jgi:hypothetical protein
MLSPAPLFAKQPAHMTEGVDQVVECLLCKHKALSSNSSLSHTHTHTKPNQTKTKILTTSTDRKVIVLGKGGFQVTKKSTNTFMYFTPF